MKTIAGDLILLEEGRNLGSWAAECVGCGWTYGSASGVAGYYGRAYVSTAARAHASECVGDQRVLW